MQDDIDLGPPIDFDDLDLPDPESQEADDDDPTAFASTAEILAAVTARVEANQSIGEVDLDTEEGAEPTLAHQGQPVPAASAPAASPAAVPAAREGGGAALAFAVLAVLGALAATAWLAAS